jgi:ABC-2 type transport system ATP-binding protein
LTQKEFKGHLDRFATVVTTENWQEKGIHIMSSSVIETHLLTKCYGKFEAVRRVSIEVPKGSICGFLGRNGSGKSSTLKMLMGAIHPTSGTGQVCGYAIDDPEQSVEIRKRAAFVSEDKRLYEYMTVGQIIGFTRRIFPGWREDLQTVFLQRFPLPYDRKIKKLSKGMRTQLALLLGIARGPELLVLDEPTEGLDPVAIEGFLQFLQKLSAEGITVFFSSHQIAEVEQVSTHLFIIDHGQLLLKSSVHQLKQVWQHIRAELPEALTTDHLKMNSVQSIRKDGRVSSVFVTGDAAPVVDHLQRLGAISIDIAPASIKDIFLQTIEVRK